MVVRRRHALCAVATLALQACRSQPAPAPPASASVPPAVTPVASPAPSAAPALPSPTSPPSPPGLTPLVSAGLVTLAVPGYGEAVVSVPVGASERRPVALALHGNFDRPEWQCDVWRRITQGRVFVLCPRGVPRRDVPREMDRWEWSSLAKTKAELLAALAALRSRYADYVQEGPIVFTGFSLGAILGVALIQDQELNVGSAVLVEGGYRGWTAAKVRGMKPRLRRVLFACGQTDCRNAYRYQLAGLFERAGIASSVVADVKAGHTYDEPVAGLIQAEWPSIVEALGAD